MGTEPSRLEKLRAMLEKSPGDTFLLYAVALEFRKLGDTNSAIEYLDKVIQHDWGYCYAYHQKGQIQEQAGDLESARQTYRQGIDAAGRKGDQHAASEISASLEMIAGSD
jgi:tetratricopeptide (TPR) repeat protein